MTVVKSSIQFHWNNEFVYYTDGQVNKYLLLQLSAFPDFLHSFFESILYIFAIFPLKKKNIKLRVTDKD